MKDALILLAALVMIGLALVPKQNRRLQLTAVLAWALVWVDNAFTGHWTDWLGVAVTLGALGAWLSVRRASRADGSV